jgi:hypothetical protein
MSGRGKELFGYKVSDSALLYASLAVFVVVSCAFLPAFARDMGANNNEGVCFDGRPQLPLGAMGKSTT